MKLAYKMNTEQASIYKTNPANTTNLLHLYNTQPTLGQYLIYNLFRILRPLRLKYNLTINELVLLTGIITYTRFNSTTFSISAIRKYIGYFSGNKMNYYIKSLQNKECIVLCDIYNGYNRYKLTDKGIEVINSIDSCYQKALNKFCVDNGISV